METLECFVKEVRHLLNSNNVKPNGRLYLDLNKLERVNKSDLEQSQETLPAPSPLLRVICRLRQCIRLHYPEHLHAGLNELFIYYLLQLNDQTQRRLTEQIWGQVEDLLRYALNIDYPFITKFWNYLCNCTEPVLIYVLDASYFDATEVILNYIMNVGRLGVRAGLHTSKLQHVLRIVELKCEEQSQKNLLELARDIRQNMET